MPQENLDTIDKVLPPNGGEIEGAWRSQRSEMVQEIVSNKPGFLIRYGIVFFLSILIFLIAACWFIEYPDTVTTQAKLTSINAPKEVITKTQGKLVKLFAKENEQTKQGSVLGYMESIADHKGLIQLSIIIDSMQNLLSQNKTIESINYYQSFATRQSSRFPPPSGEIEGALSTFEQSYNTFRNYLSGGFYLSKVNMLNKDLAFLRKLHNNLLEQKGLNVEDLNLSQKTFKANKTLNDEKVISDFDYRNENSKLIGKKLTLPQISSSIISNEAQQNEKLKEIAELQNTIAQQKSIFYQALNTFKSQIEEWKQKYLLIAPIDGKIAFATFLQENQQSKAEQVICFVNPENTEYYAEINIPQTNFGKIKLGQKVLLKFPSYPSQEYGSVNGKIDFISYINTDSGYLAKVILPNGLNTSYKKQIQFRDGLLAQGEIITQDMRLLERFYYNIVKQVKK